MYGFLFSEEEMAFGISCDHTVKCVRYRDHNKMESTGCTVKCDPKTMLSDGAERYYLFVCKHGQKKI